MHNSNFKKISIALCIALLPISVFAAGLGRLNVDSGIGEPLRAEIELLSVSAEELSSITATIASEEAYANQGIERPASHSSIKVEVAKSANGAPILKLKSAQPISEPYLDMLIQVDWNTGRLLREYTVLLDPPGYTGEVDASAETSQTSQAPVVSSSAVTKDSNSDIIELSTSRKTSSKSTAKASAAEASSVDSTDQEYLTQSGDTLAKIAREMKPENVSLEQMLVGLYEANPDAFRGQNMNRLKVGQIIRAPSEEALNAISRKEANREIKIQSENWNAYKNKLADIVAETAPMEAEASSQLASGKIKAAEDKSAPAATGSKDVVKLSAGEVKEETAETKSLQAKITALQEEVVAREKGLKEAQDRTSSLEKQIEDMQKLLALKNDAMLDMQKQAETKAVTESASVPEQKPVETAKLAEPVANMPTEMPAEKPSKPVAKPVPAATAEAVEQPSFIAGMGLDPILLGAGGVLIASLGGGWMYLRNKRKKSLADFEQGIMTSGGLKANTVFGNTSGASVDTGDSSFLTDFSQSAHGGMIDTNDVDPIAEAEVYMAYGRDVQAEEILKDAISKEPKRYELHLKLLEMYAASKNMSAFETVSGELYTTLGTGDPVWAKVAEIGIKLEPNNPLYQGGTISQAVADKLDASDFAGSPLAAEEDLNFTFDNDTLIKDSSSESLTKDADLNFDAVSGDSETESLAEPGNTTGGLSKSGLAALAAVGGTITELTVPDLQNEMQISAVDDSTLDFDIGELKADELTSAIEQSAEATIPGFSHTMPDLDFSRFDISNSNSADDNLAAKSLPTLEMSEDTALATPNSIESLESASEDSTIDFDSLTQAETAPAESFGFDIATITPDIAHESESNIEVNAIDLSGITLDMEDATDVDNLTLSADEPAEVETKLELIVVYMNMDDREGARELLDEVMKDGGAGQRRRAEALLAQLR
ncbi:MAG: FimV/HubP family polar landmark protein [Methylophilaceae bacterium]